jgi:hypothetical protein
MHPLECLLHILHLVSKIIYNLSDWFSHTSRSWQLLPLQWQEVQNSSHPSFPLSSLNPSFSNLVMPFKSSLPVTNPHQSLCLSLPMNPLQKILLLFVTSPALPTSQLLLPVLYINLFSHCILPWLRPPFFHPCWLSQTSATLFPFYSGHYWPWAILPQEPTLPALPSAPATSSPFSSPPASHTHFHTSS